MVALTRIVIDAEEGKGSIVVEERGVRMAVNKSIAERQAGRELRPGDSYEVSNDSKDKARRYMPQAS